MTSERASKTPSWGTSNHPMKMQLPGTGVSSGQRASHPKDAEKLQKILQNVLERYTGPLSGVFGEGLGGREGRFEWLREHTIVNQTPFQSFSLQKDGSRRNGLQRQEGHRLN